MEPIYSTIIGIIGAAITGAAGYLLNKKIERKEKWIEDKINHYKVLISAISDLAVEDMDHDKANMKFALAVNTIALVAPYTVIKALMDFHDEIKFTNTNQTKEGHDQKLKKLILEIRKDIGRGINDNPATFDFHLVGSSNPDAINKRKGKITR